MPKNTRKNKVKRAVDFNPDVLEKLEEAAKIYEVSVNNLVGSACKEMMDYMDREGHLLRPFRVVFIREYDEFQKWKSGDDPGKSKTTLRKTA